MALSGFRARNHPAQVANRGASLFPDDTDDTDDTDDRGTDRALFSLLDERFRFSVDVAASPANALCRRYYTKEDDGLTKSWTGERVWCNPPYSNIPTWVRKAWQEWGAWERPELIVMLLPANRTEQGWWQAHIERARDLGGLMRVEFLPGRPRFVPPPGVTVSGRPPFGCCLAIWERK
jgi:phage N-6-adenine-methyltransferase